MSDLKVLSDLIERLRQDQQFDLNSEEFMGFLNVNPSEDFTAEEFKVFKELYETQPDFLEGVLMLRGLEIQKFSDEEAIFITTEDPFLDRTEWQGRTHLQIQTSNQLAMGALTVTLICLLSIILSILFNL